MTVCSPPPGQHWTALQRKRGKKIQGKLEKTTLKQTFSFRSEQTVFSLVALMKIEERGDQPTNPGFNRGPDELPGPSLHMGEKSKYKSQFTYNIIM